MHYYQFHIGDYRASTSHLSNEEDLAYRRLIDWYYDTEKPIPVDSDWVAKRIRCEKTVVEGVLKDMFKLGENGWHHQRCDTELVKYQSFSVSGAKGAAIRWGKAANGGAIGTLPNPNSNQQPITNNQQPITKEEGVGRKKAAPAICPEGVPQTVWDDFVKQRASQKAPLTETALEGIQREAVKAGVTMEWALRECCSRGWRGFKSEWVPKAVIKSDDPNVMFGRRTK